MDKIGHNVHFKLNKYSLNIEWKTNITTRLLCNKWARIVKQIVNEIKKQLICVFENLKITS